MRNRHRVDRALMAAFALNVFDALITVYGVTRLGAVEMNPLMATALERGVFYFVAVKLLIMGLACWLLSSRYRKRPRRVAAIAALIVVGLLAVCGWNIVVVANSPPPPSIRGH